MFKKKPQIKQLAPLRSSDRRKIADQILEDLGLQPETPLESDDAHTAALTQARTALREQILPENAMAAKFSTTQGPDQKPVSGTVYVGSWKDQDQRVLWFQIHKRMYPSVYMLWRMPGIIPVVHTTGSVFPKLQSGADLMTPGLTLGPPFDKRATKGALVGIADMERESVPLVVGTAEIDICSLQEVRGMKGHAVKTMHWAGDELWAWSPSGSPGVDPPEELELSQDTPKEQSEEVAAVEEAADKIAEIDLEDEGEDKGGVSLENDDSPSLQPEKAETVDGDVPGREEDLANEPEREMSTKEIDDAFRNAFLYGVHHHMNANRNQQNYGLNFPIQQSWVLSNLVQPFLPAFTPQQASQLQIKKTSFKNIKKFIRSLDKEGIIKSKERDGNEVVVFDIDFEDAAIQNFTPYRLPKKETAAGASLGRGTKANDAGNTSGDSSIGQTLKILTLYKPKEKLAPLFEPSKSSPHELYSATDLGNITTSYIEAEHLVKETNKRFVTLDPFLANTVFSASAAADKEVLSSGLCTRALLQTRVLASCAKYHHIIRNAGDDNSGSSGGSSSAAKPKAGAPPKVSITLETRSGNKTVTKVSGLEPFSIPPQPLADELRKACAGSTSVERLHGSSPKNPVMEVMVQGPQRDAVLKALQRRGVDKDWVDVVDKTKGRKK